MSISKIENDTRDLYNQEARDYNSQEGHRIHPGGDGAYRDDILEALGQPESRRVLDVGAGTGELTRVLDAMGFQVTGADFSADSLQIAREKLPHIDFVEANVCHEVPQFEERPYDLIVSRQFVCHIPDPIETFALWKRWLTIGGSVAMIDGFWSRNGWSGSWNDSPDELPLACVQSWATVRYMLRKAGFSRTQASPMARVNGFDAWQAFRRGRPPVLRSIVVATNEAERT
jgi:ubiquinone/menaquinone biosynthesis C-methylase UbiE